MIERSGSDSADLRSTLDRLISESKGLSCAKPRDLIAFAKLENIAPGSRTWAGHFASCKRCSDYWSALQTDAHPSAGEILAVTRGLVPGGADAEFLKARLDDHIDRCTTCRLHGRQASRVVEIASRAPSSIHLATLVTHLRTIGGTRIRRADGSTVPAVVLDSSSKLSLQNGVVRTVRLVVESANVDAAGNILVILDVPSSFRRSQIAVEGEDAAVLLPAVDGSGRIEVRTSSDLEGKAVNIDTNRIWALVQE